MAKILRGKEVSESITQKCAQVVSDKITNEAWAPKIVAIVIGDSSAYSSYLKGIQKKSSETGVLFSIVDVDADSSIEDIKNIINKLNNDKKVNGILLMRPLPDALKSFEREICESISKDKDIDAANCISVAGPYLGIDTYFPCTAEACVKILEYYNYEIEGKNIVVVGRSLVVGKPVANILLNKNATVTICHSKTQDLYKITKKADIVIVAIGQAKMLGSKYFSDNQIVIDAGINWDEKENKLCGDVDFDSVEPIVKAITPVPGGVGTVTSSILISHVI